MSQPARTPGIAEILDRIAVELTAIHIQIQDLTATRERLTAARDALTAGTSPPTAGPIDRDTWEKAIDAPTPPIVNADIDCPECAFIARSPQGLATHRARKHAKKAKRASSSTDDLPAPRRDPDAGAQLSGGMVLRCACGHDAVSLRSLVTHTSAAHDRMPTNAERTPVRAEPETAA